MEAALFAAVTSHLIFSSIKHISMNIAQRKIQRNVHRFKIFIHINIFDQATMEAALFAAVTSHLIFS